MPWKFTSLKIITETESEASIDSGCANSLTNRCVQDSPENQLCNDHLGKKKREYICLGPSYEDEFRHGEGSDS